MMTLKMTHTTLQRSFSISSIKKSDGTIDREEMFKFCKIFHLEEKDEEVNKLIETIDSDDSGDISFEELLKAFTK